MALSLVYTDDFNRADSGWTTGNVGGGWVDGNGGRATVYQNKLYARTCMSDPHYQSGIVGFIFSRPATEASSRNKITTDVVWTPAYTYGGGIVMRLNGTTVSLSTGLLINWTGDGRILLWYLANNTATAIQALSTNCAPDTGYTVTLDMYGSNPAYLDILIKSGESTIYSNAGIALSSSSYPTIQGTGTIGLLQTELYGVTADNFDNMQIWKDVTPIAPTAPTIAVFPQHRVPSSNLLLPLIRNMAAKSWLQVNNNSFQTQDTPANLKVLGGAGYGSATNSKLIMCWSSFAWDTKRSGIIIFGGGHANYGGNDTYHWDSSTLLWARGSLPSAIEPCPGYESSNVYRTIDNGDTPISSHTYDCQEYLPAADRFITFGGASFNAAGPFTRLIGGTLVRSGPYFLDPAKFDGNKVGGATGCGVDPNTIGSGMWQNRDIWINLPSPPSLASPFSSGTSAVDTQNGKDVVYVQNTDGLFKYTINSVDSLVLDTWEVVGATANIGTQGCASFNPVSKTYLRTAGLETGTLFAYYDLTGTPGPSTAVHSLSPTDNTGGLLNTTNIKDVGLDFDPVRRRHVAWYGGNLVYNVQEPQDATGWEINIDNTNLNSGPGGTDDNSIVEPEENGAILAGGILGKWKYAKDLDVFIGLKGTHTGDVWVYKPSNWVDPHNAATADTITVTAPSAPGTYPNNGYDLYVATTSEGLATAAVASSIGPTETAFTHARANKGTAYYKVLGKDNQGTPLNSPDSNIVSSSAPNVSMVIDRICGIETTAVGTINGVSASLLTRY